MELCGLPKLAGSVARRGQVTVRQWGIYLLHAEDRRLNRRMRLFAEEIEAACLNIGIEIAAR